MLELHSLEVVVTEWDGTRNAYGGDSTLVAEIDFDLRGYQNYHGTAIAKEILKLGGKKYDKYPLENLASYIRNVIEETRTEVRTNSSIVSRVAIPSGSSGFPSNDESTNLVTEMTVVFKTPVIASK